ncbi:IncA protein [Chlamydia serpentis]|uniref:IncA protein n=1 Tax=Chlamydia serpentis TaxID=1967782 RepID=A0A2R8FAN5_9CHLA|nr:hypothetical protein [Chlamydia serpentis]SPN73366.1 IncA protein [Chlamydia serpentis]
MSVHNQDSMLSEPHFAKSKVLFFPQSIEVQILKYQRIFIIAAVCLMILGTLFICTGIGFLAVIMSGISTLTLGIGGIILGSILIGMGILLIKSQEQKLIRLLQLKNSQSLLKLENTLNTSDYDHITKELTSLKSQIELFEKESTAVKRNISSDRNSLEAFLDRLSFIESSLTELKLRLEANPQDEKVQDSLTTGEKILERLEGLLALQYDYSSKGKNLKTLKKQILDLRENYHMCHRKDLWLCLEITFLKKEVQSLYEQRLLDTEGEEGKGTLKDLLDKSFQESEECRCTLRNLTSSMVDMNHSILEAERKLTSAELVNFSSLIRENRLALNQRFSIDSSIAASVNLHQCQLECLVQAQYKLIIATYEHGYLLQTSRNPEVIEQSRKGLELQRKLFFRLQKELLTQKMCELRILEIRCQELREKQRKNS